MSITSINGIPLRNVTELCKEAADERQKIILKDLQGLIDKGLLKYELVEYAFSQDPLYKDITYREVGKLVLTQDEYISKLEKELNELRTFKMAVQSLLKGG